MLGKHLCTEKDFAKFYEPSEHYSPMITRLKQSQTLWCLDEPDQIELFGNENTDFGRLNLMVLPCNFGLRPGEVPRDNPRCETSY